MTRQLDTIIHCPKCGEPWNVERYLAACTYARRRLDHRTVEPTLEDAACRICAEQDRMGMHAGRPGRCDCPCHYPGEPTPTQMIGELQEVVWGSLYATSWSAAVEWENLLAEVRTRCFALRDLRRAAGMGPE